MNLSKKIIGIGLSVVLSALAINHDYPLYKKIKSTDAKLLGMELTFHGGSATMRKQFYENYDKLLKEKTNLLDETYVLEYFY